MPSPSSADATKTVVMLPAVDISTSPIAARMPAKMTNGRCRLNRVGEVADDDAGHARQPTLTAVIPRRIGPTLAALMPRRCIRKNAV